jgi:iron complex outermembrane receptor protein
MKTFSRAVALGFVCSLLPAPQLMGQADAIAGTVSDSATNGPLFGVDVRALGSDGDEVGNVSTDFQGRFRLSGLPSGRYQIEFARWDYRSVRLDDVSAGVSDLTVTMVRLSFAMEGVSITGSRTPQVSLDVPVSTSVVTSGQIEETTVFTAIDPVRTVTGVDFASKGLMQHTYAVRGGLAPNSAAMLTLSDYRNAGLPSLRLNVPYLVPTTSADIERIEVVRGPAAALYGPNSDRGVLHIITRSPFDSRGTSISVAGGERSVFQGSVRHAGVLGSRLGFKLSGDYFRGGDWEFEDPEETAKRNDAILGGADPDTLLIGRRDFDIQRAAGRARLDWRPDDNTTVRVAGGLSGAINNIDLTAAGGTQVRDWRYHYGQVTVERGRVFFNTTYNVSDAGDTYQLRTGDPIVDNSRMFVTQLQHGTTVGDDRYDLLYGVDFRRTVPRTGGTIHGRNEDNDNLSELGGYLHTRTSLSPKFDLTAALRIDYHNRIDDLAVSPRVALVFKPTASQALRFTYNRSHGSPDAQDLFADLSFGPIDPSLPYDIFWRGTPRGGFNFRRDCGGLCMRSPFNPQGEQVFLPADATLMWDVFCSILGICAVPAPNASQVGTILQTVDLPTETFEPTTAAEVRDVDAERRTMRTVFEVGYKGVIDGRIQVGVDLHHTRVSDAVGELQAVTPNVFLDRASLEQYLTNFMPPAQAAVAAAFADSIPLGTISPEETGDADVVLVERQGSDTYTVWGADFSIVAEITEEFTARGTYSWMSKNVITGLPTIGDLTLGAPRHKGAFAVRYHRADAGFTANAGVRTVGTFPVGAGLYSGRVSTYTLFDAGVGYRIPGATNVALFLTGQNVLDNRHQEFVGAPELGRLVTTRLSVTF